MKGMAYIPFAILASSAMLMLLLTPMDVSPDNVGYQQTPIEAYNLYHESVEKAYTEKIELSLEKYLYEVNNTLANEEESIDADDLDAEEYVDGEFNGETVIDHSLNEWITELEDSMKSPRNVSNTEHDDYVFVHSNGVLELTVNLSYDTAHETKRASRSFEDFVSTEIELEDYDRIE